VPWGRWTSRLLLRLSYPNGRMVPRDKYFAEPLQFATRRGMLSKYPFGTAR
jgi:hypothetical protein